MLLRIDNHKPDERRIQQVVDCLKAGGIIIYPTDTVYTLGCDMLHYEAYQKLCKLKNEKAEKANFSIVCADMSHLSQYAKQLDNSQFRTLKQYLPGPYTFILNATKEVVKIFHRKKDEIGFRVPDHAIPKAIVQALGNPILSASIKIDNTVEKYLTDPEEIAFAYEGLVNIVIDGGIGGLIPSTIVKLTETTPEIIREGLGEL